MRGKHLPIMCVFVLVLLSLPLFVFAEDTKCSDGRGRGSQTRYVYVQEDACVWWTDYRWGSDAYGSSGGTYNYVRRDFYNFGSGNWARTVYRSYIKFSLSQLPSDVIITSARLYLYRVSTYNTYGTQQVYFIPSDSWNENTITWGGQPSSSTYMGNIYTISGRWRGIDMTSIVQQEYYGDKTVSIMIRLYDEWSHSDEGNRYHSKETSWSVRPRIRITYVDYIPPETSATISGTIGKSSWYTSSVTVTLSATDKGTGVATTYYSINNSAYSQYTSPVQILWDGVHTFSYYSDDVTGNIEPAKTMLIKVDMTPPVTESQITGRRGSGIWYSDTYIDVFLSASDNTSGVQLTHYILDGALLINGTHVRVYEQGIHNLTYYSVDVAGNVEAPKTLVIYMDNSPPVTTPHISADEGERGWYVSDVTVILDAEDVGDSGVNSTYYVLDGIQKKYTEEIVIEDEGVHTLMYYSIDNAGNVEDAKEMEIKIDKTPPTIEIISPRADEYIEGDVELIVECDEKTSDVSVFYRVDDGSYHHLPGSGCIFSTAFNDIPDGLHIVEVYAIDDAGNACNTSSVLFYTDRTPPEILVVKPKENEIISEDMAIRVKIYEMEGYVVEYSIDDENWKILPFGNEEGVNSTTVDTNELDDGAHTLRIRCINPAGMISEKEVGFIVDNTAPSVFIAEPSDGQMVEGIIKIRIIIHDETWINAVTVKLGDISLDCIEVSSTAYECMFNTEILSDGDYRLSAMAEDSAGHLSEKIEITIRIDNNAPEIVDIQPEDGSIIYGTVEIKATVSDAHACTLYYSIDASHYMSMDYALDTTRYDDGIHIISIKCVDEMNHETVRYITVKIDNNAPELKIITPKNNSKIKNEINIQIYAYDELGIQEFILTVDGMNVNATYEPSEKIYSAKISIYDGMHAIEVNVSDISGKTSSAKVYVFADSTPPEIVVKPGEGTEVSNEVKFTADLSDKSGITTPLIKIDDGDWIPMKETSMEGMYEYKWKTTIEDNGEHTVSIKYSDSMGNEAIHKQKITVNNPDYSWLVWVIIALVVGIFIILLTKDMILKKKKEEVSPIDVPTVMKEAPTEISTPQPPPPPMPDIPPVESETEVPQKIPQPEISSEVEKTEKEHEEREEKKKDVKSPLDELVQSLKEE